MVSFLLIIIIILLIRMQPNTKTEITEPYNDNIPYLKEAVKVFFMIVGILFSIYIVWVYIIEPPRNQKLVHYEIPRRIRETNSLINTELWKVVE